MKLTTTFWQPENKRLQTGLNLLLFCGLLSSLYYVVINIIAPTYYPGYRIDSQTVSELSAIGAPSRHIWVLLCSMYSFLVIAFGMGIYVITGDNKRLKAVGAIMFFYGISGFFWPPMHQREVIAAGNATITDTLHLVFAGLTTALMLTMMGLGAFSLGNKFRSYTILSIAALILFGILTSIEGKNIRTGEPTPLIGIWERINIGIFLLWAGVLSVALVNSKKISELPRYMSSTAVD